MIKKINFNSLPKILPIFPLPGVIVLPNGSLPLNVFEPRYISMVEDILGTHRMIGMIQPCQEVKGNNGLYPIGCASKIISFSETSDNRYLVELKGVIRFKINQELELRNGYRNIEPEWRDFKSDLNVKIENLDISEILNHLKEYFLINNINVNFEELEKIPNDQIVSAIPQICSFKDNEKQAILEAVTDKERIEVIISLLKMNILEEGDTAKDTIN